MTGFILIEKHIKECLTMFGVITLMQIVYMEFIQTKNRNCLSLKAMDILGTKDLQMTHLLGAAVLKNAMAESGYAMKKSKLSQLITIYLIQQMLKREKSARRWVTEQQRVKRLHAKRYLLPKKTSAEKQRPIFQHTTQTKGQLTERGQHIRMMLCTVFLSDEPIFIGGYNSTGQRQKPLFAIERWNLRAQNVGTWNCERIKRAIPEQTTPSKARTVTL